MDEYRYIKKKPDTKERAQHESQQWLSKWVGGLTRPRGGWWAMTLNGIIQIFYILVGFLGIRMGIYISQNSTGRRLRSVRLIANIAQLRIVVQAVLRYVKIVTMIYECLYFGGGKKSK